MEQTPYQKKLWRAAGEAHTERRVAVEETLKEMIAALENDHYNRLPALCESLPFAYRALLFQHHEPPGTDLIPPGASPIINGRARRCQRKVSRFTAANGRWHRAQWLSAAPRVAEPRL